MDAVGQLHEDLLVLLANSGLQVRAICKFFVAILLSVSLLITSTPLDTRIATVLQLNHSAAVGRDGLAARGVSIEAYPLLPTSGSHSVRLARLPASDCQ